MKYAYTYFPELAEITSKEAQELLYAYYFGTVELDPKMLALVEECAIEYYI